MNRWQSLSKRDRRALILGGLLLTGLLGWQYVLGPVLDQWRAARQRIVTARTQQASLLSEAMQRRTQRRRLTTVFGPAASTAAPPLTPTRANLVKTVKDLADAAGVDSQDVRAQPLRPLRALTDRATLGLTMELTGEPDDLADLLAELHRSETLLMVERLSVSGEGERGEDLDITLTLSTLVQFQQQSPEQSPQEPGS